MNWLGDQIQYLIEPTDTVLDIGCGIMQATYGLKCKSVLGVDIWKTYLNAIKKDYPVINLDTSKQLDYFLDDSFDVIICLDLLEHLKPIEVNYVLEHMIRICRKKVIIFTPASFDTNEESCKDAWGLGPCQYQLHQSLISEIQLQAYGFIQFLPNQTNGILAIFEKSIIGTPTNENQGL